MRSRKPFMLGLAGIVPLWALALSTTPLEHAATTVSAQTNRDELATGSINPLRNQPTEAEAQAHSPVFGALSGARTGFPAQPANASQLPPVSLAYAPDALRGSTHAPPPVTPTLPSVPPLPAAALPVVTEAPAIAIPAVAAPVADDIIAADTTGVRPALALYAKGDIVAGDRIARGLSDPVARAALEHVALRSNFRALGYDRLMAFRAANPLWPSSAWLDRRSEEVLYGDKAGAAKVQAAFATHPPQTPQGKLALARALLEGGERDKAAVLVRDVWREAELPGEFEHSVKAAFGELLRPEDHKYRASRFLFKEDTSAGLRNAALAGGDYLAVAQARAAVINEASNADALYQAVPLALRNDPGLLFSRIQHLRRAQKLREAADLMRAAPHDPAVLVNGDEWWVERRLIARTLLDMNDAAGAYLVAQGHNATSGGAKVEAEFHAGWIALRFLKDARTASRHFELAAAAAETPMSKARAFYWQGRAADAAGEPDMAAGWFEKASEFGASYYGQLAQNRLGRTTLAWHEPAAAAQGEARDMSVRVIELLYAIGETVQANMLAQDAAQRLDSEPQLAALAAIIARQKDARLMLGIGKTVTQRGLPFVALAFPTFGVPAFQPLDNSAERAMVYSIARQESAFQTDAVSKAGAKGLMQMLVSTAQRTAQHKGVPFDAARLISDPAFNAQLGAAHLGELLDEQNGSYVLTFAAYNAGGKRVKEWIAAYGDPRLPGVDPVDWVERIPITETRNYVQRIVENMQIYRYRLGDQSTLLIDADLRRSKRGT